MKLLQNIHAEGGAAMVGVVIALMVAIYIGVLIWFKTNTAIINGFGSRAGVGTSYAGYNASILALNNTAVTVWNLFPIIGIIVVAGVILAVVMNFGRSQGA
jgi:hypothetical protein